MQPVIQKFRGAVGGFNRKDVLQYIERLSVSYRQKVAALEEQLSAAGEASARLEEELAGLRNEKGDVAAEEARVRTSLEEATAALTGMRGELSQTEAALAASRQELARLQAEVGELAPMARSYGELKDRVATIELDAHRKAQATIDEANAEADRIRAETAQWLEQVRGRYGALRQELAGMADCARKVAELEGQLSELDDLAAGING